MITLLVSKCELRKRKQPDDSSTDEQQGREEEAAAENNLPAGDTASANSCSDMYSQVDIYCLAYK